MAEKKFELGSIVSTPGAAQLDPLRLMSCLAEHVQGRYGNLEPEDCEANDNHIAEKDHPGRVHSVWTIHPDAPDRGEFWIITDSLHTPDAVTTFLLPDEY